MQKARIEQKAKKLAADRIRQRQARAATKLNVSARVKDAETEALRKELQDFKREQDTKDAIATALKAQDAAHARALQVRARQFGCSVCALEKWLIDHDPFTLTISIWLLVEA